MSNQRTYESQERAAALRRQAAPGQADSADATAEPAAHPLVALQRQLGNARIERMLAQRAGSDEEEAQAKHDPVQRAEEEDAQAKHDPVQREAEDDVQAQHDSAQRAEDDEQVQAKPEVGLAGGPLSADLSGRINAQRGSGATLDGSTRSTMEQSFGTSFADVRVHTDAEADTLNRNISAKAFTTGSDIFFRKDTSPGDHSLLAHELTHVVQQRGMGGSSGGMSVGAAGDSHEQQADSVSQAVTTGTAAQAQREYEQAQIARMAAIQREEDQDEEQV